MRLICPNCGAQYEVEDSVIPDEGRDVQCSNCGHTWFQRPAHMDEALAEELNQRFEGDDSDAEGDVDPSQSGKPAKERRELDPQVKDVLRAEAAREAAARRGESTSLETQPELGLDDPGERAASRSAAARARMARLRGADDTSPEAAAAALAAATASRRDLLPDIEEINSSLRAGEDRDTPDSESGDQPGTSATPAKRRSGFRLGFSLMILFAAVAVAVYVLAPQIVQMVPQTEPYMTAYVTFANELRVQAGQSVAQASEKIRNLIASITGG